MATPILYVVRRCDNFYRFWHDVTCPAALPEAMAALDELTDGGAHNTSPSDFAYFDIFAAFPASGFEVGKAPLIRRLHRHDTPLLEEHFLCLDQNARRLRFFGGIGDTQIRAYVASLRWDRAILIGAILEDQLIGVSEAHFDGPSSPAFAELAITVADNARGRGLARHLFGQTVDYASAMGVERIHLDMLDANRPMRHLIESFGGVCGISGRGELVGEIPPRRALRERPFVQAPAFA